MIRSWVLSACVAFAAPAAPQDGVARDPAFQAALEQIQTGEVEEAVAVFERLLGEQASPKDWLLVAQVLVQSKQWLPAEPFARRAHELASEQPRSWSFLGAVLLFTDRASQAEELLRASTKRFPKDANLVYSLGMACGRSHKELEAQRHYETVVAWQPRNSLFLQTAGENALLINRDDDALKYFRRAAAVDSPHPDAAWRLAQVLGFHSKDEEAEQWFRRALQRSKGASFKSAQFQYAVFLYERRRHAEALAGLERMLLHFPEDRMAWQYKSRCFRALGRDEEAAMAVRRYREIQRQSDQEEDRYLLGLLEEQLKGPGGVERAGEEDGSRSPDGV